MTKLDDLQKQIDDLEAGRPSLSERRRALNDAQLALTEALTGSDADLVGRLTSQRDVADSMLKAALKAHSRADAKRDILINRRTEMFYRLDSLDRQIVDQEKLLASGVFADERKKARARFERADRQEAEHVKLLAGLRKQRLEIATPDVVAHFPHRLPDASERRHY